MDQMLRSLRKKGSFYSRSHHQACDPVGFIHTRMEELYEMRHQNLVLGEVHAPAAGAGLPLAVVVDGGDGGTEVVQLGELPGVEVVAPHGGEHRASAELLEQHEHQAVDPGARPWVLVAQRLLSFGVHAAEEHTRESYESVKGPQVIASDINPGLIDHLRGPKLAPVRDFPGTIPHAEGDASGKWIQHVPDYPSHNQWIRLPTHGQ
ncbi:hypothetical protein BHM03_00054013 [Ensete ventricosum]|nr:hypothetical protein BHM03_00054013 [Ensete ventricosum]